MHCQFSSVLSDLALAYRYRPAHGVPAGLVVLMHGVGSNEDSLLGLASFVPEHYAVALVRFPIAMGAGAYSAFAVNFTAAGPSIDSAAAEASRRRLVDFVGELQGRYGVAANRTVIGGFSQGGIMAASLALTEPGCVAGFAILSGRILPDIEPLIASQEGLKQLAALVVHGDLDERLPPFWADRSETLLRSLGIALSTRRFPIGHQVTREVAETLESWLQDVIPV